MNEERRRFEQLLPFYLNGTLDNNDQKFVENYLRLNPEAVQSMSFAKQLQGTLQALAPDSAPDAHRLQHFMGRWRNTKTITSQNKSKTRIQWLKDFLLSIKGLGLAAVLASAIFFIMTMQYGLFDIDSLDGRPDLELVLTSGVAPDHEVVVAQLKIFNAVILSHSEQEGYHHVLVDLQSPAKHQYPLIDSLQASGHLKDFRLLAAR